jgi:hypothetical protein
MLRLTTALIVSVGVLVSVASLPAAAPNVLVTVRNPIDLARTSETLVLPATELATLLAVDDVRKVHVLDGQKEMLTQAIDLNDDGKFEQLIFQTDIGPNGWCPTVSTTVRLQGVRPICSRAAGRFRVGERPHRTSDVRCRARNLCPGSAGKQHS